MKRIMISFILIIFLIFITLALHKFDEEYSSMAKTEATICESIDNRKCSDGNEIKTETYEPIKDEAILKDETNDSTTDIIVDKIIDDKLYSSVGTFSDDIESDSDLNCGNTELEDQKKDVEPLIRVSNVTVSPGNIARISVNIENNPGILGVSLRVFFDETIVELINAENGKAFRNVLNMSSSPEFRNGSLFLWDGEYLQEGQVCDGEILEMEFRIKKTASADKIPITLVIDDGSVWDNDLRVLNVKIENGYINII